MNESYLGWLDRDGNFFPCGFREHYDCAIKNFNKDETSLEEEGVVKIYYDKDFDRCRRGGDEIYYVCNRLGLSQAQVNWLIDHNFNICEFDLYSSNFYN